jgi:hypothetical protein
MLSDNKYLHDCVHQLLCPECHNKYIGQKFRKCITLIFNQHSTKSKDILVCFTLEVNVLRPSK